MTDLLQGGTQAKLSRISEAAKKLDWDEYSRELRDLWRNYDKDGSGFLDREEAFRFIEDMLSVTAKVIFNTFIFVFEKNKQRL